MTDTAVDEPRPTDTKWEQGFRSYPMVSDALRVLLEEGDNTSACNRERLLDLLWRLHRSRKWKKIDKPSLKTVRKSFKNFQETLATLEISQVFRDVYHDDSTLFLQLIDDMPRRVATLDKLLRGWDGRVKPRRDSAIADLIRYVEDVKHRPHYEELHILMSAVLDWDKEPDEAFDCPADLADWRHAHQELFRPQGKQGSMVAPSPEDI